MGEDWDKIKNADPCLTENISLSDPRLTPIIRAMINFLQCRLRLLRYSEFEMLQINAYSASSGIGIHFDHLSWFTWVSLMKLWDDSVLHWGIHTIGRTITEPTLLYPIEMGAFFVMHSFMLSHLPHCLPSYAHSNSSITLLMRKFRRTSAKFYKPHPLRHKCGKKKTQNQIDKWINYRPKESRSRDIAKLFE